MNPADLQANPETSPELLEANRQLLRLYRAKKRAMGLQDLYFFDREVLGYKEMAPQPHRGLCRFVQNPEYLNQLILEPRGCFKTSCITIGYSIFSILHNNNIRILLDSEDLSITKTFLREIKGHFESNEELIKLYGNHVGDKWTEAEIIVGSRTKKHLKEPTIATSGIETTRVSQHYDLIILDDPHSQQNIGTPEQIEKVKTHFKLLFSLLDPGGKIIVIGTRWHFADLYSEIIEKETERRKMGLPKRFRIRKRKAIDEDGNLHFPTRLTEEFLRDTKIEQGSYVFSCQYQNEPVDQDSAKFKKSWFKFYGDKVPPNLTITAVLDPAISEKDTACYTAITVVGTDLDGYMYVLDLYRARINPTETINAIFMMQEKWNPHRFGIEVVAYQKTLKYWLQERFVETRKWINIVELKTDTRITKPMRIEALVPYVENGLIAFPGFSSNTVPLHIKPLVEEMEQFPVGKYVDCLDSLAYHPQITIRSSKPKPTPRAENTIAAIFEKHRKKKRLRNRKSVPTIGHDRLRRVS